MAENDPSASSVVNGGKLGALLHELCPEHDPVELAETIAGAIEFRAVMRQDQPVVLESDVGAVVERVRWLTKPPPGRTLLG